jgi:hypothetical protein
MTAHNFPGLPLGMRSSFLFPVPIHHRPNHPGFDFEFESFLRSLDLGTSKHRLRQNVSHRSSSCVESLGVRGAVAPPRSLSLILTLASHHLYGTSHIASWHEALRVNALTCNYELVNASPRSSGSMRITLQANTLVSNDILEESPPQLKSLGFAYSLLLDQRNQTESVLAGYDVMDSNSSTVTFP